MPDELHKIFDLMDTETEPTDERLAELMSYVGEAVRTKKKATEQKTQTQNMASPVFQAGGLPAPPVVKAAAVATTGIAQ